MLSKSVSFIGIAIAAALTLAAPASAAGSTAPSTAPISVEVNMARILRISSPAATVVIGNPGIADVTIQDPETLVLTGKSYGHTNMIVMDAKGNPIADTSLQVLQTNTDVVTVFNGGQRTTVACAPSCEPTVMLGDDPTYSQQLTSSMGLVQGIATSQ